MACSNIFFIVFYTISMVLFLISVAVRFLYNDFPSYLSYAILFQEIFIQICVIGIAIPLTMDRSDYKYAEPTLRGQDDSDIIVNTDDVMFSLDKRRSKAHSKQLFIDPTALFTKDDALSSGVNPMYPADEENKEFLQKMEGATVALLIPCYKEDKEIIETTLSKCYEMNKPNNVSRMTVYLCNDGGEAFMYRQDICDQYGAKFISRPNPGQHGKAGNLNYTLETYCQDYDFVIILDADMAPRKNCVDILLSAILATTDSVWWVDPTTCDLISFFLFCCCCFSMVQAPHRFRDLRKLDLFQSRNLLFHAVFLPYYGATGYCPFVGSNAIFRNAALKAVGNIPTDSVTEDVLLGLRLHAMNYMSLYITADVAYGTSPQTGAQLLNQRMRWSWGGMDLFLTELPTVLSLRDFRAMLPYLNLGMYNLLFGPIMLTMVIALSVAVLLNIEFLPRNRRIRMSLVYICIQRIALIVGCGGPTWRDFLLVNSEFISSAVYGPFFEIVLTYNFLKYVLTAGKGMKVFKSTASTLEMEPEHMLIYTLTLLVGCFIGTAGSIGVYRSIRTHYYTYMLLSISLILKSVYIASFLVGILKPCKAASRNYAAPVEVVAERVFHSRLFMVMISLPMLELALFIAVIISAIVLDF